MFQQLQPKLFNHFFACKIVATATINDHFDNLILHFSSSLKKIVPLSIFSIAHLYTQNLSYNKSSTRFKFTDVLLKITLTSTIFLFFLTSRFILPLIIHNDGSSVWTLSCNMTTTTTLEALNSTTLAGRTH